MMNDFKVEMIEHRGRVLKYSIQKRIKRGGDTWGYLVKDCYNHGFVMLNKETIYSLVCIGAIENAEFNISKQSLNGVNGTDLRKIGVVDIRDILGKVPDGLTVFSDNHIEYLGYIRKCRISNKKVNLVCGLLEDGGVVLENVTDKESRGEVTIPVCITSAIIRRINKGSKERHRVSNNSIFDEPINKVNNPENSTNLHKKDNKDDIIYISPFTGCNYTIIKIDGDRDRRVELTAMFSGMRSDRIQIESKCSIVEMSYTFANCNKARSIVLVGLNTRGLNGMVSSFYRCNELKGIVIDGKDMYNIVNDGGRLTGKDTLESSPLVHIKREETLDRDNKYATENNGIYENKKTKYKDNMRGKGIFGIIKQVIRGKG